MSATKSVPADSLNQIHELNRLFLKSLQARDAAGLRESGFPVGAFDLLRSTSAEQIGGLAEFPRALFDLAVEGAADRPPDRPGDVVYSPRKILELTILFCAWNVSRDSVYHARLFFGLAPRAVHTLRTALLTDLPRMALTAIRVECAFADSEWLWRELLTETRPEARRQLILVALQPSVVGPARLDQVAE
jgi:hypothetical protein